MGELIIIKIISKMAFIKANCFLLLQDYCILLSHKITLFYMKYKLVIFIVLTLVSLISLCGVLYYTWIVYNKIILASAILTSPKGQAYLSLLIEYKTDTVMFLQNNMPETDFRNWFHAIFEQPVIEDEIRIFHDHFERAYYVFDEMVEEAYYLTANAEIGTLNMEIAQNLVALDPLSYGAYQETVETTVLLINTINEEIETVKTALEINEVKTPVFTSLCILIAVLALSSAMSSHQLLLIA